MAAECAAMLAYSKFSSDPRIRRYSSALLRAGWTVHVISLKDAPCSGFHPRLIMHSTVDKYQGQRALAYILSYARFLVLSFVHLMGLVMRGECSIIHVHNMPNFIVFAALIPKLLGAKVILDLHDTMPELFVAKFGARFRTHLYKILVLEERISALVANTLIVTCNEHKQIFESHGLRSDNMSIVMNLPDPALFFQLDESTSRAESEFRFIYHGTLSHRFGVDIAIRAFKKALDVCQRMQLWIIGGGDQLPGLLDLVNDLGLREAVMFTKRFIPTEQVAKYICEADVGVIPNRRDRSTDNALPTKLLEYVFMHKPCIMTRTATTQHYFSEDMLSYVEAEDVEDLAMKMIRMYRDKSYRQQLVRNANEFNDKFKWETCERQYFDIIKRLLDRPGGAWPEM